MRYRHICAAAALLGACMTANVSAAQTIAYAAPGTTNVRTGPGLEYAIVGRVRGGDPVEVLGCLGDLSWCNILVGRYEGWMAARRLVFPFAGRYVRVPDYYDYFRAPIIRYRKFRRPPPTVPVTPPCPFPDPRECQPLKGGDNAAPGGGGPDYPPNYKPGNPPQNTNEGAVSTGETTVPMGQKVCHPSDPDCQ
jgi:uncharacterized protein YraI